MSYCLNPDCFEPQNPDNNKFCDSCGSKLLLSDRFRAIKLIERGGMGRTFLAVDEAQSPPTARAISQFCPPLVAQEAFEKAIALFQQEAIRLQELGKHPQIPAVIAYFEQDRHLYLVQEFIEGTNLAQVVESEGTFSEAQIWQLLEDLLPVLKFIHDRQVIHRDIKPANIIRRSPPAPLKKEGARGGELVLVDFGAAKLVTEVDLLKAETSIGSPEYVALEQLKGKAVFASDLYSLGVSCIYLLTGIPPFDLFDVANDCWVWRDYLMSQVSEAIAQILDKLIQNAVNRRFQSVDEVMQAINKVGWATPHLLPEPEVTPEWECCYTIAGLSAAANAIAISPCGKLLVSGGDDKTVCLWDLKARQLLRTLLGHTHAVRCVAVSPCGNMLASCSDDKTIRLWDLATGTLHRTLAGHSHAVKSVAFSPCGQMLASGSWDKTVKLWDVNAGVELATLGAHRLQVSAIAFSPGGQMLASGSFDRTVRVWEVGGGNQHRRYTLEGHAWSVQAIAFSPDGKILASGSDDNTIKLWDIDTGHLIRTVSGHSWSVVALTFSPDGQSLISGSWDKTVKFWLVSTGEVVETLAGHSDSVCAIAVSPCGQIVASSSKDKTIKLWQKHLAHHPLAGLKPEANS